jgi:hypothetical protein
MIDAINPDHLEVRIGQQRKLQSIPARKVILEILTVFGFIPFSAATILSYQFVFRCLVYQQDHRN